MTTIKYMLSLLVHDQYKYLPLGKIFKLHLFVATTCTYEKYINCYKIIELNIKKTSELKNSIIKIKEKIMPFSYAQ